jgi:hypothetical protein
VCREEYWRQRWWGWAASIAPCSRLHRRANKTALRARSKLRGKHNFACCLFYRGVVHLRNVSCLLTDYVHYMDNSWYHRTMIIRYCFTLFLWCRVKKKLKYYTRYLEVLFVRSPFLFKEQESVKSQFWTRNNAAVRFTNLRSKGRPKDIWNEQLLELYGRWMHPVAYVSDK